MKYLFSHHTFRIQIFFSIHSKVVETLANVVKSAIKGVIISDI